MKFLLVICSFSCILLLVAASPIVRLDQPSQQPEIHSQPDLNDPRVRAEANEFMRSQGVTQDEIDEYNRLTGFNPMPENEMVPEGRMFGLERMLSFWNWTIFDRFRQWILKKRGTAPNPPVVMVHRPFY